MLAQLIRLRDQLDYLIKSSRFANPGEFTFQSFYDYCLAIEIDIEIMRLTHIHRMT